MDEATIPGPTGGTALRWWGRLARDPLSGYLGLRRRYGDAVRMPFRRGRPLLLLSRPEHAEHVLAAEQDNYVKAVTYRPLQAFLGSGLLTGDGELWARHRSIVQPVLARRHIDDFAAEIVTTASRATTRWQTGDEVVDVAVQMRRLTLDVVGRVLFGASLGRSSGRVAHALGKVQLATTAGILLAAAAPEETPWRWLRRMPGVSGPADSLDEIVTEIIAGRRREPPRTVARDLLDLLLRAHDEEGSTLADDEIRDEVLTLMLAGHETTSTALTWTLALLSRFPESRRRLEAEVDEVLAGQLPAADNVERLRVTRAVIEESLRLYPPAWTIERDAVHADDVCGVPVGAGSTVVISPYLVHRHPEFWPAPDGFDPERFLSDGRRPRYAFMPFGGGRRVCVGAGFAMFEATLILAAIAQTCRLDLVADGMPTARALVTLQPRGPVPMRCTSRR